jgi:ArsR family transcriptional regulator
MDVRPHCIVFALALAFCLMSAPAADAGHGTEDDVETITVERVKLLLDAGEELIIVDLRPSESFRRRRLPGARSIPLAELDKRFREIPKAGRVVLYCDCTQNELIEDAYRLLKDDYSYRNVALMIDGFSEWERLKYPMEISGK